MAFFIDLDWFENRKGRGTEKNDDKYQSNASIIIESNKNTNKNHLLLPLSLSGCSVQLLLSQASGYPAEASSEAASTCDSIWPSCMSDRRAGNEAEAEADWKWWTWTM